MTEETMEKAISRDTRVTLGAAIGAAIAMFTLVLWADRRITALEYQVESVRLILEEGVSDRWTQTEMRLWAELLQAKNDSISVPVIPRVE